MLIYEGDLVSSAVREQDVTMGREDDGSPMKVLWVPLEHFRRGEAPLYPDGLLELLLGRSETEDRAT